MNSEAPQTDHSQETDRGGLSLTKRILFAIITVLTSIVVAMVVLEIGLRLFWDGYYEKAAATGRFQLDPVLGWRNTPGYDGEYGSLEFLTQVRHDSHGYRGPEVSPARIPNTSRVLILGDSMIYGHGVSNGETFCDDLSKLDPRLETINLGVSGYSTAQQYLMLQNEGLGLQPDVVVACTFWNDIYWDNLTSDGPKFEVVEGELKPIPFAYEDILDTLMFAEPPLKKRILSKSYLYRFMSDRLKVLKEIWKDKFRGQFAQVAPEDVEQVWARVDRLLAEMRDLCAQQGIRFLAVYIPDQVQIETEAHVAGLPPEFNDLPARLQRVAQERAIAYLDPTDCLQQNYHPGGNDFYFDIDRHFTPEGHAAMADCLLPVIRDLLSKPPADPQP